MKTFGRFFSLLGLLLVVLALPGQENRSLTPRIGAREPAPDAPGRPTPEPGFGAITTLDGGENCTAPTPITGLPVPFNDTGNTSNNSDSTPANTQFLMGSCAHGGTLTRPGPDVFYSFIIVGYGNSVTFTVTPTGVAPTYDPAIYVIKTCTQLSSCVDGADAHFDGEAETLTVSNLAPGTYFFGVDSMWDSLENPEAASGPYSLQVTGNFGDPSITPTATPTRTPTPTVTGTIATVTPTRTPTPTATPTVGPLVAGYYTLTPCRVADTRDAVGPFGGPALAAGASRSIAMAGRCAIPAEADAVAINVTVTQPTAPGFLTLYPLGVAAPLASTVNYSPGQTRANNAIIKLGSGDSIVVTCGQSSGATHFIVDVVGYFRFVGP